MEPVKYQLSKREYVLATAIRFWRRKLNILAEITWLVLAIVFWHIGAPYASAFMLIMALVVIPLVPLYLIDRTVKSNPKLFLSETTLISDRDGIQINNANGLTNLNWDGMDKWFETPRYIFIMCPGSRGLIIPKRAFTNEQLTEFKTLLSEKIRSL